MGKFYRTRDEALDALRAALADLGVDPSDVDMAALRRHTVVADNRMSLSGWGLNPEGGEPLRRYVEQFRRE